VWVEEAALAADEVGEAAASDARVSQRADAIGWATFRVAEARVALAAANVGELLRLPPLRRELPQRDGVMGLCEWRGRLVPVVDLAGALHVLPPSEPATWLCIACEGDLAIGLVVHEVLEIARIAPDEGTPEQASASERSVVGRRLVKEGHTLQLLDMAALLRRYEETAISARGARAATSLVRIDPEAPAYMVFDAGGMFAAPIDGVQEVVGLPDELRAHLEAGHPATLQWREQAVPVTAIGDDLVALPAQAARQLLVIRRDDRLSALAIVGVKAMVPRGIAQRSRMRMRGRPVEVISVETEDHRASYPVVDLLGVPRQGA
jgi:chemotaxis signal transduction protein